MTGDDARGHDRDHDHHDSHDLAVVGGQVVTPEQGVVEADVGVDGDVVTALAAPGTLSGEREIDADGRYVLPGVVDPHVHHGLFRPLADDAESESRSGLVGGVTTTGNIFRRGASYLDIMDDFVADAEANYYHDYFFTLGVLSHDHVAELPAVVDELGVTSFKWYENYKLQARERFGVERDLLDDVIDAAVRELAAMDAPTTLAHHAENAEITAHLTERLRERNVEGYDAVVERFPGYAEAQSAVAGATLTEAHGYDDSYYVVHVSSADTVAELERLKRRGHGLTAETCTHYLCLTREACDDRMKVNPPVRNEEDREALWGALADGTIDVVGTDHISNRLDEKVGDDIWESMWGSPSGATMLPLVLSEGVNAGRLSLRRAAEVTSTNAAKAYDLYPKKGTVRVGSDADLAVVDLDLTREVDPDFLRSHADYSMFTGREVTGWPTHTVVRGEVAYAEGEVVGEPGYGTHVDRPIDARYGD